MNIFANSISEMKLMFNSMPSIGVTTFIDIGIVSYIIYKGLTWIKETRAWSLLKGIVFIILLSFFSHMFNLYTVSWIISNTFGAGLIAVIVLFTPEIRKALEQIGSSEKMTSFFQIESNTNTRQISTQSLDSIMRACNKMAQTRTGAIIVIENKIAIGDVAETGIVMDSLITIQLLVNIFEDKTPLHDGAVVIRNNRIASACCILPLTKKEIGKELGTRHRASVGMSEVSDSYVIIVSEETGHISLAYEGKLYKNIDEAELKDMIRFSENIDKKKKSLWKGRIKNEKI